MIQTYITSAILKAAATRAKSIQFLSRLFKMVYILKLDRFFYKSLRKGSKLRHLCPDYCYSVTCSSLFTYVSFLVSNIVSEDKPDAWHIDAPLCQ
jgi:hypothetical protein